VSYRGRRSGGEMQQPEVLLLPTYEFLERAAIFFLRIAEQSFTRILLLSSYGISVDLQQVMSIRRRWVERRSGTCGFILTENKLLRAETSQSTTTPSSRCQEKNKLLRKLLRAQYTAGRHYSRTRLLLRKSFIGEAATMKNI
jgi:hypothetical protein